MLVAPRLGLGPSKRRLLGLCLPAEHSPWSPGSGTQPGSRLCQRRKGMDTPRKPSRPLLTEHALPNAKQFFKRFPPKSRLLTNRIWGSAA